MEMTLKQMTYFISVCQTSNLTKSAEELYISQPTLSVVMKELEQEIGVPLFTKKGNRLVLTEAGEIFREEVLKVLQQYENLERRVRSGSLNRNYIRFGFSTIVGNTVAPELCIRFKKEHPEVRIHTFENYGHNLLHQLDNDRLDVVVTGGHYAASEEWADKFHTYALRPSSLMYYVAREDPLASKKEVTLEEIARNPVIMLIDSYPIAKNLEENFLERNLSLNIVLRTSQMYTVERFVSLGVGGGFLPPESASSNTAIVQVTCKDLELFQTIPTNLFWKKSSTQYPSINKFVETTKKAFPRNP